MGINKEGTLKFIQHKMPPLISGNHTIKVSNRVERTGLEAEVFETFETKELTLVVNGKQFNLDGADIQSVYPPANQQGRYSNVFPNIVFVDPTLPWQRLVTPDEKQVKIPADVPPADVLSWLGLMTFGELDPDVPQPRNVTVDDLQHPPAETYFPFKEEDHLVGTDPVTVIDVPVTLFNHIAPSLNDLAWLAHTREVDVTDKATTGDMPAPGTMSVVIGNRLPPANMRTTVYLVSFENYAGMLPADNGTPNANTSAYTHMRMVVLHSWGFMAISEDITFAQYLQAVNVKPASLQQPYTPPHTPTAADHALENTFNMGYTGFNHVLRDGGKTVSWYRGPLLPFGTSQFMRTPYVDADQLLRYDPASGMFDTSYSAAWQLGRLLAMNDRGFALAMSRWKALHTSAAALELEQRMLDEHLGIDSGEGPLAVQRNIVRIKAALQDVVKPIVENFNSPKNH